MNNKSSIFTSGEATVTIPLLVFMSEIKNDLSLKKSNFLFLFYLKVAIIYIFLYPFCVKFDAFSVFTGYGFGCKHSLQLKYSSKLRLNKHISRNLHRQNAYRRLRRPDVTCFHNVNLARLVTSLTP